ncbi:XRE family transcriptional regulator [Halieaceae bacterium IMCC14734]|uniref:XRE family transcriptional regulator n=1 Tax=Candidatus Litorirhabdus singularis TaxID=2518993 RepID=A0ABT3TGW7_9GAMM|nr:helix-turn-helix transcriptional regulator [Candidatus Litorirhabdus singularis]MCX2981563.1 XRE family transcriptional regulator [Candidatus Litorirhabdus singularis]
MKYSDLNNEQIVSELGRRLARARLNRNISQQSLATEAGITRKTLSSLENGSNFDVSTLVRLLRGLELLDSLESLAPADQPSPMALARFKGKTRRRAGSPRTPSAPAFRWGEDE